jgi:hypothetical protein
VLKPGGRIAVFDKFLRDREYPSLQRRMLNALAKPLFSDLNRRLGPLTAGTPLVTEHDEPVAFGGTYRVVTLMSPGPAIAAPTPSYGAKSARVSAGSLATAPTEAAIIAPMARY